MTKEGPKQVFELNPERISHWKQQKELVLSVPKIHWSWCVWGMPRKSSGGNVEGGRRGGEVKVYV